MNATAVDHHLSEIHEQGYTILEGVVESSFNSELQDELRQIFVEEGIEPKGTRAEGYATRRLYNLVPRAAVFRRVPVYEPVLTLAEQLLENAIDNR